MIDIGLGTFVTYNPKSVSLEISLVEVMRLMDQHHIRHLPIVNSRREVVGIVSDMDVAHAVLASGSKAAMLHTLGAEECCSVESIMVANPITIDDHDAPRAALEVILDKRIHSVPVVDEGRLVGMITSTDYLRELSYGDLPSYRSSVSKYINECHTVIDPDTSVEEAHTIMERQGADFLAVAQGNCPVGIVSMRDLRRAMDDLLLCDSSGESNVMSLLDGQPPTILASSQLGEAATKMIDQRVKALAVVNRRHHLAGLLTEDDVLRAMLPDLE